MQRIGLLVEVDRVLLAARQRAYFEARQRVLAFHPGEMTGVDRGDDDHSAGTMRDDLAPIVTRNASERGREYREILGAVGVGVDIDQFAMRFDIIAQSRFARRDAARFRLRVGQIDEMTFAGVMAVDRNHGEPPAAALAQRHEPGGIGLLDDEPIGFRVGADDMAKHLGRAMILVHAHIIKALRVAAPDDGAIGLAHDVGPVHAVL